MPLHVSLRLVRGCEEHRRAGLSSRKATPAPCWRLPASRTPPWILKWSNKIVAANSNPASKTYFIEGMDHTFNVFSEEDLHSLYNAVDATGEFFAETLK